MPRFLLTFGHVGQRPVGVVIIEAPSMFQARMTAVARRFAPGVVRRVPQTQCQNDDVDSADIDRQDDVQR
jgi:hypothetical protein